MEHKDYSLEMILLLRKQQTHLREMAKVLKTNHTTIRRKAQELSKENVIDYKKEGKNSVYFIKKTIEAKRKVYIAEQYAVLQALRRYPELRQIIRKIDQDKRIKLAILFGSYAKAKAKKASDLDLFIETTNKDLKKEMERMDEKISLKIGKYNKENLVIKEIEKNHVILKGVSLFYEKNKFFD